MPFSPIKRVHPETDSDTKNASKARKFWKDISNQRNDEAFISDLPRDSLMGIHSSESDIGKL